MAVNLHSLEFHVIATSAGKVPIVIGKLGDTGDHVAFYKPGLDLNWRVLVPHFSRDARGAKCGLFDLKVKGKSMLELTNLQSDVLDIVLKDKGVFYKTKDRDAHALLMPKGIGIWASEGNRKEVAAAGISYLKSLKRRLFKNSFFKHKYKTSSRDVNAPHLVQVKQGRLGEVKLHVLPILLSPNREKVTLGAVHAVDNYATAPGGASLVIKKNKHGALSAIVQAGQVTFKPFGEQEVKLYKRGAIHLTHGTIIELNNSKYEYRER